MRHPLSRYPQRWAAAVDHCGRSDLAAFAVPPHWRRRMRDWVGDPVEDAETLRQRSPITHAHQIQAPLLVVHGDNDTRVPRTESDRIVNRLRELGKRVEYLVLGGDGHATNNRENTLLALTATASWFTQHLLNDSRGC